ncbi:MAG: PAS domain S-box protein, partial [Cyanobacteria bacterium P01_A01_bin.84]
SVVESTDDAIITKTLDGIITSWNRAAMNLFGYSPTEVIGKPISILFPPERMSEEPQIIKRLKNGEKIEHFETVRLHKNGTPIHVSVTISPLRDDLRNIAGASKIVRDITNRKQVEAAVMQKSQELEQTLGELQKAQLQIVQSEKMAALGNLVAGVAHEINNPVGFLYGSINNSKEYIQNLFDHIKCYQENHPTPDNAVIKHAKNIDLEYIYEDLPKLLNSMNIAAERITKISHSLRIFSRTDTSKKVTCNIHESINSTILILKYRLKANDKRPAIAVIKDYGELHTAKCFLGQLNQVFMNILVNAIDMFDEMAQTQTFEEIKANPQQITISTKVAANHRIFIRIRDNGKGMTNEIQAQIFDNLFTTKGVGKGTGLGLAIVRQIIEEIHGGKLICKSRLGEGTEFLIELPFE